LLRLGRGTFSELMGLIKANDEEPWKKVKYCVFDCPQLLVPFERRIGVLNSLQDSLPEHVHIVSHTQCRGIDHFNAYLQRIVEDGGEGVVLRKPNSMYESGRSDTLYKCKVTN
jgi:DNA ligase-1